MPRSTAQFALPAVLLSLAACAGTSVADRMPTAAATVQWTIDHVRQDLAAAADEAAASDELDDTARRLLELERRDLAARLDRASAGLARAERELDTARLAAVADEVPQLAERVGAFHRSVLIAEAAARTGRR